MKVSLIWHHWLTDTQNPTKHLGYIDLKAEKNISPISILLLASTSHIFQSEWAYKYSLEKGEGGKKSCFFCLREQTETRDSILAVNLYIQTSLHIEANYTNCKSVLPAGSSAQKDENPYWGLCPASYVYIQQCRETQKLNTLSNTVAPKASVFPSLGWFLCRNRTIISLHISLHIKGNAIKSDWPVYSWHLSWVFALTQIIFWNLVLIIGDWYTRTKKGITFSVTHWILGQC